MHTPLTGAAVFGGVGMGPQEHAFRSGVDVIVATPGRLLDHFRFPYAKLEHLEVLVLDEADRMLDMGFLPDIRRVLKHLPARRQTLFFSATMPPPIVGLAREMLKDPATVNLERKAAPAVGITHAVYPVAQELKSSLLVALLERNDMPQALVFTRTKHRANRLAEFLDKHRVRCERIHGNRSQAQRTQALAGFKGGRYRVLVATDIAARGIDVEALSHVINFDVPGVPEDYIHRVGRTARAEMTGDAFTFVAPEEEGDIRAIERRSASSCRASRCRASTTRSGRPRRSRCRSRRASRRSARARPRTGRAPRPRPSGARSTRRHRRPPTGRRGRRGPVRRRPARRRDTGAGRSDPGAELRLRRRADGADAVRLTARGIARNLQSSLQPGRDALLLGRISQRRLIVPVA